MGEQRSPKPPVVGSSPAVRATQLHSDDDQAACPSGRRGLTVNQVYSPPEVRILLLPLVFPVRVAQRKSGALRRRRPVVRPHPRIRNPIPRSPIGRGAGPRFREVRVRISPREHCPRPAGNAFVAQRIEHLVTDQGVGGSNPSGRTGGRRSRKRFGLSVFRIGWHRGPAHGAYSIEKLCGPMKTAPSGGAAPRYFGSCMNSGPQGGVAHFRWPARTPQRDRGLDGEEATG